MKTLLKYTAAFALFALIVPAISLAASFGNQNYFYAPGNVITALPGFTTSWGSGGSQTPWLSNIDASYLNLNHAGTVNATNLVATSSLTLGTAPSIWSVGPTSTLSNSFVINATAATYPYFVAQTTGNIGIASSSPDALLSIMAGAGYNSQAKTNVFEIGSSTQGLATTTLLNVLSNGVLQVGGTIFNTATLNVMKSNITGIGGELNIANIAGGAIGNAAALNFTDLGNAGFTGSGSSMNSQIKSIVVASANLTDMVFSNWNSSSFAEGMRLTGAGNLGVGSSTPTANLQVTTSSANATSSLEVGKLGQTKGSCLTYFDTAGNAVYGFIAAGATSFTYTSSKPAGCQS